MMLTFGKKRMKNLTDEEDLMLLYQRLKKLEVRVLKKRKKYSNLENEYRACANIYVLVSNCYNKEPAHRL